MAGIYDLYIKRGSDFSQELDADIDLSTYNVSIVSDTQHLSDTGNNIDFLVESTDLTNGIFTIKMARDLTNHLRTGVGSYRVEVLEVNSDVKSRLMKGAVYIDGDKQS